MRELLSNNSLFVGQSKQINHSLFALVIWSPLQLTSKQWIITQQFTARADLFLKHMLWVFIRIALPGQLTLHDWVYRSSSRICLFYKRNYCHKKVCAFVCPRILPYLTGQYIFWLTGYDRSVLMNTHNICFYREFKKVYPFIIIKYPPYLFLCLTFLTWDKFYRDPT